MAVRVAHLIYGLGLGGLEQLVLHLAARSRSRGVEYSILALGDDGPVGALARQQGVDVELLPVDGMSLAALLGIRRVLEQRRVSVLHAHDLGPWLNAVAVRAVRPKTRVLATFHEQRTPEGKKRHAAALAARATDALVACGDKVREDILGWAPAGARVPVIENGVPLETGAAMSREEARAQLRIPDGALAVGYAGGLREIKGPDRLLQAFLDKFADRSDVHLFLIGAGPMESSLRAVARGHANVHFTGLIPNAARLLSAFDVYAQTSLSEGRSLSMLKRWRPACRRWRTTWCRSARSTGTSRRRSSLRPANALPSDPLFNGWWQMRSSALAWEPTRGSGPGGIPSNRWWTRTGRSTANSPRDRDPHPPPAAGHGAVRRRPRSPRAFRLDAAALPPHPGHHRPPRRSRCPRGGSAATGHRGRAIRQRIPIRPGLRARRRPRRAGARRPSPARARLQGAVRRAGRRAARACAGGGHVPRRHSDHCRRPPVRDGRPNPGEFHARRGGSLAGARAPTAALGPHCARRLRPQRPAPIRARLGSGTASGAREVRRATGRLLHRADRPPGAGEGASDPVRLGARHRRDAARRRRWASPRRAAGSGAGARRPVSRLPGGGARGIRRRRRDRHPFAHRRATAHRAGSAGPGPL